MLQIVPDTGVMGEGEQIGVLIPAPALTMVRLAWVKLLLLVAPQLHVERALILKEGGIHGHKTVHGVVLRAQGTPTHCNASDARLGSYGKRVCHSSQNFKPGWRDPRECIQTPSSNNQSVHNIPPLVLNQKQPKKRQ